MTEDSIITDYNSEAIDLDIPLIVVLADNSDRKGKAATIADRLRGEWKQGSVCLILMVDHKADVHNLFMVAWQMLGNSDPLRDHTLIDHTVLLIDGTIKFFRPGGFPRRWPNIVTASDETISSVSSKWDSTGLGPLIASPSIVYKNLIQQGNDELT
jgi:4-hydroxy-3-polyprenylbenzoate decarboxylase